MVVEVVVVVVVVAIIKLVAVLLVVLLRTRDATRHQGQRAARRWQKVKNAVATSLYILPLLRGGGSASRGAWHAPRGAWDVASTCRGRKSS